MKTAIILWLMLLAATPVTYAAQPALPLTPAAPSQVWSLAESKAANVSGPPAILAPACTPTPTPTPKPNGSPLAPAELRAGTPYLWQAPNDEWQTLVPYTLSGQGQLGVRLWAATQVRGIAGWLFWCTKRDANGVYLELLPIQMPDTGVYQFVVVYPGNRLQDVASDVAWEVTGANVRGSGTGVHATVYRTYLPLVLR